MKFCFTHFIIYLFFSNCSGISISNTFKGLTFWIFDAAVELSYTFPNWQFLCYLTVFSLILSASQFSCSCTNSIRYVDLSEQGTSLPPAPWYVEGTGVAIVMVTALIYLRNAKCFVQLTAWLYVVGQMLKRVFIYKTTLNKIFYKN